MQLVLSTVKRLEVKNGRTLHKNMECGNGCVVMAVVDAWLWLSWIRGYGFTLGCHNTWTGHGANWITTEVGILVAKLS